MAKKQTVVAKDDIKLLSACGETAISLCKLMEQYVISFMKRCMQAVHPRQKITYDVNEFSYDKSAYRITGKVNYRNGDRIDFVASLHKHSILNGIQLSHWHHKYGRDILTKDGSGELVMFPNMNESEVVKSIRYIEEHKNKH